MFPVERRALGVFAALGVALLPVVVADRLSNSADSSEPGADSVTGATSSRYVLPSRAASPRFKALKTMNLPNGDVGRSWPRSIRPERPFATADGQMRYYRRIGYRHRVPVSNRPRKCQPAGHQCEESSELL